MKVTDDNNVSISASSGESYVVVLSGSKYAEVTVPSGTAKTVSTATSSSVSVSVLPSSSTSVSIAPVSRSIDVFGKGAKGDKGEKGEPGISGSGSSFLTEQLTVTNPVGEAESGQVYSQLTKIEEIVRDLLTGDTSIEIINCQVSVESSGVYTQSTSSGFQAPFFKSVFLSALTVSVTRTLDMTGALVVYVKNSDGSEEAIESQSSSSLQDSEIETHSFVIPFPGINITNFTSKGKNCIYAKTTTQDGEVKSPDFEFFRTEQIRVFTTISSNPRGSNIEDNPFGSNVNLYEDGSTTMEDVVGVEPNEDVFSYRITEYESEEQEVIADITPGPSDVYSSGDPYRYTVVEIPSVFSLDECAATTAGSGAYSLTKSIVYLGNQKPNGEAYVNQEGTEVKYYRFVQSGAFTDDIKLDLKITKV